MPHIKVVFLWPYARPRGVNPAYARAYAYAYYSCICIPPTQARRRSQSETTQNKKTKLLVDEVVTYTFES